MFLVTIGSGTHDIWMKNIFYIFLNILNTHLLYKAFLTCVIVNLTQVKHLSPSVFIDRMYSNQENRKCDKSSDKDLEPCKMNKVVSEMIKNPQSLCPS